MTCVCFSRCFSGGSRGLQAPEIAREGEVPLAAEVLFASDFNPLAQQS
jgi:hypothetical protein